MEIERILAIPNKWTFKIEQIARLLQEELKQFINDILPPSKDGGF